jgi:hypothetical protein
MIWHRSSRAICVGFVLMLTGGALCVPAARAGEAGTLDTLTRTFLSRFDHAVRQKFKRADLLLVIRSTVNSELTAVIRRLVLGGLVERRRVRSCRLLSVDGKSDRELGAIARKKGAELLLILRLEKQAGHLHLKSELRDTSAHLWRDLLQKRRGSLHHLYASARVDAEIRAYLQPSKTVNSSRFTSRALFWGARDVLAMATGDLDGDGRAELVVLRPSVLEIRHVKGAKLPVNVSVSLSGTLAATSARRRFGTLRVADTDGDKRAEIYLRSSRFAAGAIYVLEKGKLVQRAPIVGFPLWVVAGKPPLLVAAKPVLGRDYFATADISQPSIKALFSKLSSHFYGLSRLTIRTRAGVDKWSASVDASGRLAVFSGLFAGEQASLRRVGHAFELLDVDDDGKLEVAVSASSDQPEEDRLTLYKLSGKRLRRIWQSARLGARITAIGHGDLDGDGRIELFASTRDHKGQCRLLWLR